jgi:hypothetical protein
MRIANVFASINLTHWLEKGDAIFEPFTNVNTPAPKRVLLRYNAGMATIENESTESYTVEGRCCTRCFQWHPIDHFRRRRKDSEDRHEQCRTCRREKDAERTAQTKRSKVRTLWRHVNRGTPQQAAKAVYECLHRCYGGVEGLAAEWKLEYDAAEVGSRWRLASLAALSNLGVAAAMLEQQEAKRESEQITTASDYEIADALRAELERLVDTDPGLAIQALRRRGYSIMEPTHPPRHAPAANITPNVADV